MRSNTKKAKSLIRGEIKSFYGPKATGERISSLKAMKRDADAYNADKPRNSRYKPSDYRKGRALVDAGSFRCYYSDQAKFLSKIYGKKNVEKWEGEKIHNTYSHLIGREYDSMLREKKKRK
ncbi:MAG: hypothetical protein K6E87_03055 [bacterium]|nr:hypothetical protein [bacterium]